MRTEVAGVRAEMREGFEDLTTRLNGNTLVLNMAMGLLHDPRAAAWRSWRRRAAVDA